MDQKLHDAAVHLHSIDKPELASRLFELQVELEKTRAELRYEKISNSILQDQIKKLNADLDSEVWK